MKRYLTQCSAADDGEELFDEATIITTYSHVAGAGMRQASEQAGCVQAREVQAQSSLSILARKSRLAAGVSASTARMSSARE